jgi:hypothetical protein
MSMRKNVDQIVAGSRTQYLTQVNGMPPAVLKHVLKSQKEFMNNGKSSMISREQLMAPKEMGGLGMLDLEARNEAIQLVKAGSLAETDPQKRAFWASLARHHLGKRVVKQPVVADDAKTEILVQKYKVSRRAYPNQHKDMLKCLENRGLTFKANLPSEELQRKMPLWHHPEEGEVRLQGNNGPKAKCLR